MSTNGKGDKSRVRDVESYRKNYAAINWTSTKRRADQFTNLLNEEAKKHPAAHTVKLGSWWNAFP